MMDEKKNENYYDGIVKNLKDEASKLNQALVGWRTQGDMNRYIATLKSLEKVMELIHQYDWEQMVSKYEVKDFDDGGSHWEIAVWDQNCDHSIKNHHRYELKSPEDLNSDNVTIKGAKLKWGADDIRRSVSEIFDEIAQEFRM